MKPALEPVSSNASILNGQVAWITGAGRGLGRAVASGFAKVGAHVVITSRTETDLRELKDEINTAGGDALVLPGRVEEAEAMRDVVDQIVLELGKLDVLVNCAGISPSFRGAEHLPDEEWHKILETNLSGTFFCCREAGRAMLAANRGSIINVSSVHATHAFGRLSAYIASKGGIEALTRALALEWGGRGVRVNALAPGYFPTPLSAPILSDDKWRNAILERVPIHRIGDCAELVAVATFLASADSAYVTGAVIPVDGGWSAS